MWKSEVLTRASELVMQLDASSFAKFLNSEKDSFEYGPQSFGPSGFVFGGHLAFVSTLFHIVKVHKKFSFKDLSIATTFSKPSLPNQETAVSVGEDSVVTLQGGKRKTKTSVTLGLGQSTMIDGCKKIKLPKILATVGSKVTLLKDEKSISYTIPRRLNWLNSVFYTITLSDLAPWWLAQMAFEKASFVSANLNLQILRKGLGGEIIMTPDYLISTIKPSQLTMQVSLSDSKGMFAITSALLVNYDFKNKCAIDIPM